MTVYIMRSNIWLEDTENIVGCKEVPKLIKEEIRKYILKKKEVNKQGNLLPGMDDIIDVYGEDEEVVTSKKDVGSQQIIG